ncbi:MotA/TolQ/ExbB proton channel family protein [Leptospira jelokensis]|uniref:MotA/TolQ/ExbB proton channel family protein n=1 Tax=Leptospira jelokensis TaxID=2484931 RepID=A0A4Z0ZV98_9LEPT|nr:MotA/TolQ/ExbB proton channel family protein [Leptospira jelokensis]TGL57737.1 MotA/TolQ/ExbB proton channel family protein [Leptospira jelokensis]TGM02451.1 MotA/TolQ/ExbB proton channel family protein [Leptospira jelokensis]
MQEYVELGEELVFIAMGVASVVALAVFAERLIYYKKSLGKKNENYLTEVRNSLQEEPEIHWKTDAGEESIYNRFIQFALRQLKLGRKGLDESLEGQILSEKLELEKRLPILNTLGNNAPFIGLLGTVLGVIKAFYGLGTLGSSGAEVVMRSISTALLATAAGLAVAIPVVMANNYFSRKAKVILQNLEILKKELLSYQMNKTKV